jgi:hypothetical protein
MRSIRGAPSPSLSGIERYLVDNEPVASVADYLAKLDLPAAAPQLKRVARPAFQNGSPLIAKE